jgi:hypothetical protein
MKTGGEWNLPRITSCPMAGFRIGNINPSQSTFFVSVCRIFLKKLMLL